MGNVEVRVLMGWYVVCRVFVGFLINGICSVCKDSLLRKEGGEWGC